MHVDMYEMNAASWAAHVLLDTPRWISPFQVFIYSFIYSSVHAYVCGCVHVFVHVCTHIWRSEVKLGGFFFFDCSLHFLKSSFSLKLERINSASLAGWGALWISLSSVSLALGSQTHAGIPGFFIGTGDLNMVTYACVKSTLLSLLPNP